MLLAQDRTLHGVPIRALIPLLAAAVSLACAQTPSRVRSAAFLDDLSKGFHPGAAGYLDLFQSNSLVSGAQWERPYGTLEGYVQRRRIAALMLDPDSLAPTRLGLLGGWDQGGWADDAYFSSPDNGEAITVYTFGLAVAVPALEFDLAGGFVHGTDVRWEGSFEREVLEGARTSAFALGRWHRASALGVVELDGFRHVRAAFEPTATAIPHDGDFLLPQLQASASWSRAAWNRWEEVDAWGLDLGAPLWKDRILARVEAGSEGFRQVRLECDLASEGVVGLDLSYARTREGRRMPGARVRIPLFTLGWNDPEDAANLGSDPSSPVWSARLQMVWDGPEVYYRPGRRPSPPVHR